MSIKTTLSALLLFVSIFCHAQEDGDKDLSNAVFTLDDSHSLLKFTLHKDSLYFYSVDGVRHENDDKEAAMIVFATLAQGRTAEEIAEATFNEFNKGGDVSISSTDNVAKGKTNGYSSFQRAIRGVVKDDHLLIFQHVVIIKDYAIVFVGITAKDYDTYYADFQNLSSTVKWK